MYKLRVNIEDDAKRIDNVVTKNLAALKRDSEISRALIQHMITDAQILLNGSAVKVSRRVKANDIIEINLDKLEEEKFIEHDKRTPKPEKLPLKIIYEDKDILVIDKPAGMVVHPACGNYSGTLVNALLNYKGFLTEFNEPRTTKDERRIMRPGIVHRLDKDTSGIMLVAKTGAGHRKLSRQLKNRFMLKKYIAVVRGIVELDQGIINLPINHDKKNRMKMVIDRSEGKEAVTHYKVIIRNHKKNFTVLEVTPKTGRTHQIRIHLSHIGHPILGDMLYNGPYVENLSRQALHAKSIGFIHPTKNTAVEFSARIPSDMQQFFQ